ncbi:vezatin isoform X5 [Monodelphis domestica]|uniref:vezatin isoform X5 n=1 Tax=Monodelphis domestica TaxID=13616 RepID=UPI000443441F|nr:vezatin isoform X5 [Monodelphis domestica]
MTPEFDEEVVFENSPLYQYLQDLGQTDFEICSSVSPKAEQCTSKEGQQENSTKMPSNGILLNLVESFTRWTSLFQCCKNDDLLHKLDVGFRLDSIHTILQQEVLLQEDVELIELLDPSILSTGQPQQQEDGHLPTLRSLATPNIWVSAACPFNKAGQHPSQHLIGLRKAVYRTVRANFRAARLATLYMLKNYPLNSESDNVTNYICVVPFKELGLGLSEEQVSEEEAHNLTDGFSLPALKVLFQLWVGQSSEFFRRLALLLSTVNAPQRPLLTPALSSHRVLLDVTQGLPHAHAACLEELKRSYEFYRYFETQHRSEGQRLSKTKQKSKELNSLHTAVRSLQLHLKALLNEVIILEDELEKLVGTKEAHELASEAYHILEQKLKLLQPRVQASNSCWEEALSQVDKLVRRNSDKKGKPEVACETPHCAPASLPQPALCIEDKDPIPEEQELEAYVDDTDMDIDFRREDFYFLSQEDRERQKREREESKRVLQELKSVLGFKASESERQKWKQLLFSDHAVMKPLSPVEPMEPINNSESSVNSDMEKDGHKGESDPEEGNSELNPPPNDTEISRTEYLYDDPSDCQNKDNSVTEGLLAAAEEKTCYQYESEGGSEQTTKGSVETLQPALSDSLQTSIRERLARLHRGPDFNITSGLAAQAAARSLTFTSMEEQTFEDSEEEEEDKEGEQQKRRENENEVEENKNKETNIENEGL